MSLFGTLVNVGANLATGNVVGAATAAVSAAGGGGTAPRCPGGITPEQVDFLRSTRVPQSLVAPIAAHWERDNASRSRPAPFYSATPGAIADWLNGGSDCRHSGDASSQKLALQLLQTYGGALATGTSTPNMPTLIGAGFGGMPVVATQAPADPLPAASSSSSMPYMAIGIGALVLIFVAAMWKRR